MDNNKEVKIKTEVGKVDFVTVMTSREIAELTGKRHADVLRDIEDEQKKIADISNERIFALVEYKDAKGERRPMYNLTRKGVMQLGARYDAVIRYKIISKLEELEKQPQQFTLPQNYKEALRCLIVEVEKNEALALENKEMKPKAEFYDTVTGSSDLLDMNATAKILNIKGLGRNKLFEALREKGILMAGNLPYQRYIDADYFRVIETSINIGADVRIYKKTMLTQRGLEFLTKKLTIQEDINSDI